MFFISWGARNNVAEVGSAGLRHCEYCDKDSFFTRMVQYRVRHIYWIFRWVTDRTPYLLCGNCHGVHQGDAGDHESAEVRKAIPAWDRRGWLVGAGAIGALIGTVSVAAATDSANNRSQLAAPHVGDIYEVDLAQLVKNPEAPQMYSAMRVTGVKGEKVEVALSKGYYKEWSGLDHDLNDGAAASPDYYSPDRGVFTRHALQDMYDRGVMHDVQR